MAWANPPAPHGDGNIVPGNEYVSVVSSLSTFETASSQGRDNHASGDVQIDEDEVLKVINEFRSQHGAPPLKWSPVCSRFAQQRASHQSVTSHDFGESLARSINPAWRDPTFACISALSRWQKEEAAYDYMKPGLSPKTDHFTSNVWKLTTHVGFGVFRAKYKGESTAWVAAYFYPKGNQPGDFARNVLPRGSVYDGDKHMARRPLGTISTPSGKLTVTASSPSDVVRVTTVNEEINMLRSKNGKFRFQVLPDRNIIVRQAEKIVWNSGSRAARQPPVSGPFRLVLQKNGDLVGYDSAARVFWSSDTANCGPPPYTLTMQDGGQCVLFDGNWTARWATDSRPITKK